MAPRRRRLGAILSQREPATRADLLDVLRVLDAEPSPRGHELATATRLREWAAARWPHVAWRVQPVGADGANLVASHGPGPVLYSHLDTSLDGGPSDALVTGSPSPVGPLRVDGEYVDGFGLAVARAPAVAALLAFASASSGTLLLAGSGTHRRGRAGTGVERFLATAPAPPAAIVAKCGPPGVLWHEPGAAYLTVRVRGRQGAALAPSSALPEGGVVQHAGAVLDAVASWREEHLAGHAQRRPVGQVAAACGVGAVRSGWVDKPDLLPAELEVDVYLVTVPDEDVPALADQLAERVRSVCDAGALRGCAVTCEFEVVAAAAATASDAPIVESARAAWREELGEPDVITGWTGSTDGVVLRAAGVETVRLGPSSRPAPDDARRDRLSLAELEAFVRVYRRLLTAPVPRV